MNNKDSGVKAQTHILPTCGKCGAGQREPYTKGAPIAMTQTVMGPMLLGVFHCGNPECGAIFSIQLMEMAMGTPQAEPSLIKTH